MGKPLLPYYISVILMLLIIDSYRSFATLRMTTKRKRVILNAVKNLYIPPVHNIEINKKMMLY